jgi:HNH endonuclease
VQTQITCSVEGCEAPHSSKGFCRPHYRRWHERGYAVAPPKPTTEERIWNLIDVRGPDECWEWQGTRASLRGGYGVINADGRLLRVHRWVLEQSTGPLPRAILACHHCDNPPCCNPAHLYAGSHRDNAVDASARGLLRPARGARNPNVKLTREQVVEARANYTGRRGELKALCEKFGVDRSTMARALDGRNWSWV